MSKGYVLNKYRDEMHKTGDEVIDLNNPMYPSFDTFDKMKHHLLGLKQKEIRDAQTRLNALEEDFLILMDTQESDLTTFTRDGQ
jgi:hypothetical protein